MVLVAVVIAVPHGDGDMVASVVVRVVWPGSHWGEILACAKDWNTRC